MATKPDNVVPFAAQRAKASKSRPKKRASQKVTRRDDDYDAHNFAHVYEAASVELHDWAVQYLEERGVNLDIARAAKLRSTTNGPFGRALCIPYFDLDGVVTEWFGRWRNFDVGVDEPKFYQPPGTDPQLYMPPIKLKWSAVASNPKREVVIAEGEIKALAGLAHGFVVMGTGGIWNFRRAVRDNDGKKTGDRRLLSEFRWFKWEGRRVPLAPDSDAESKSHVALGVMQCGSYLQSLDADVRVVQLPLCAGLKKVGLDDYLYKVGTKDLTKLLAEAPSLDDPRFHGWGMPSERRRYTDDAVAEQFVLDHGDRFRFVHQWNSWYRYEGGRWHADSMKQCEEAVIETAHRLQHEATKIKDDKRGAHLKEALRLEDQRRVRSVLERARTKPLLSSTPDQWDSDPDLLGVANGAVDLKTGKLLPPDPARLITRYSPVTYDPKAKEPKKFLAFMRQIMRSDEDLVSYVQRVLGYCLTGHTSEQCMFMWQGYGDNGKGTTLNVLEPIVGRYMMSTRATSLMTRDRYGGNAANSDIARLRGARLVTASETNVDQHLDESLIKQLTGQDVITARFLNQEWFEFRPQFKIILLCNHLPKVRGGDHAVRRRMRLIPFHFTIDKKNKNKNKFAELLSEKVEILRWIVEGAVSWYRDGLSEPDVINQATSDYLDANDPMRQFIAERCELDATAHTKRSAIYDQYKHWLVGAHTTYSLPSMKQFGEMLRERGFESRVRRGYEHVYGIKLKVRREEDRDE